MTSNESALEGRLGVLVHGPEWGDAQFYGKWLLAVSAVKKLWDQAMSDPAFEKSVDPLNTVAILDFGIGGTSFLMRLRDNAISFVFDLEEEELVDEFVLMASMGFFVCCGQDYHMAIPTDLALAKLKAAALAYVKTEDDEYFLHPELVVSSMPMAEAMQCQARKLALVLFDRHAKEAPRGVQQ